MDIQSNAGRKQIIAEITGYENQSRREEHFKRQEVYNSRGAFYVNRKLLTEFSAKTVSEMRKIYSVNLTKRIIQETASIYKKTPTRYWTELSEDQFAGVEKCYYDWGVNKTFKSANKILKLHKQGTLQVIPKEGKILARPLAPHQYDVIPDPENPMRAMAYIISTLDRSQILQDVGNPSRQQNIGDSVNQKIADVDDYQSNLRFVWWTKEFNFTTNKNGEIVEQPVINPLGELPFVDFSEERDFEYWVRAGSDIVDFNIEFLSILSDHFNINKLQGYSQAVMVSEQMPDSFVVGPNHILHLKLNPNSEKEPRFEFVSPQPDLTASIQSMEMLVSLFLSSQGIDATAIQTKSEGKTFASGIERLLSMIQKFEASLDDFDVFKYVEQRYYELFKKWQLASVNNDLIADEYKVRGIDQDSEVGIKYAEPEMIQTQLEKEDSAIKLLESGLITKKMALAHIHGVSEEAAEEMIKEIEAENGSQNEVL
jgi:hypothetical protein